MLAVNVFVRVRVHKRSRISVAATKTPDHVSSFRAYVNGPSQFVRTQADSWKACSAFRSPFKLRLSIRIVGQRTALADFALVGRSPGAWRTSLLFLEL